MLENREHDNSSSRINNDDLVKELDKALNICDERIRLSKKNIEVKEKLDDDLKIVKLEVDSLTGAINRITDMYKHIEKFRASKQELSRELLLSAIKESAYLVPDAELEGCDINFEEEEAQILSKHGVDINGVEGGAVRAILSLVLSYTVLRLHSDKAQLLVLDEALFACSETTSLSLREIISEMSKNVGIVCIEQNSHVLSGLTRRKYKVEKNGNITKVRMEKVGGV